MVNATSEVIWTWNLLRFLRLPVPPTHLHCDNQAAIHITNNPVFHQRTKHFEVDCHFVCEHIMLGASMLYSNTEQPANIFIKALGSIRKVSYYVRCILNLHAPT